MAATHFKQQLFLGEKITNMTNKPSLTVDEFHNMLMENYCHKNFYAVLPFVSNYLSTKDLLACGFADKKSYQIAVLDIIWKNPNFNRLSHIHDALYMFNKFLRNLPVIDSSKSVLIQKLDISNLEETLYDCVAPDFFCTITRYCQGLKTLKFSNVQFFNCKSLPKYWNLPQLISLDLSNCFQITDTMILNIARSCRQLIQVKLDGLTRLKGSGLAGLAAECDQLKFVTVRNNTSLEDQGLVALAKFRHIHLAELDITGCKKLTSIAFEMLARYAAHLTNFSIAQTACRLTELRKFSCIQRYTQILDISSCKNLSTEQQELANWLWNTDFQQLKEITMDTVTANVMVDLSRTKLINTHRHSNQVTHLTLVNLQERTPFSYLHGLLLMFPKVKSIIFERAYFETDFMLGTYRVPSPDKKKYITDVSLQEFDISQSQVSISMIHQRENDVACNLINW